MEIAMSDALSDSYWIQEFAVTEADLDGIAAYIDSTSQAHHLSTLAKWVVDDVLLHGREHRQPLERLFDTIASVTLWDPAGDWQVGNHVIVLRKVNDRIVAYVGEVQEVELTRSTVSIFIPEENIVKDYALLPANDPTRLSIVESVKRVVNRKRQLVTIQRVDEAQAESIEVIMLEHGERIVGLLLQALRQDKRFVLLNGRWFLRDLATLPVEEQMVQLAWWLLGAKEPQSTEALFGQIAERMAEGDVGLFGLYLELQQRPELFGNTEPGKRPLWKVVGPPPGSFVPQHAAYDPESYEILCVPGETAGAEVVAWLWKTDLLTAVV